jgi:hypothetical protein
VATLVSDLIIESFLDLATIDPGVGITPTEQADAFLRLNQVIASWSTEQFSVYNQVHGAFSITAGTSSYTVGPGGTLATAARPVRITSAAGVSGAFSIPVAVLSFADFESKAINPSGRSSVLPEFIGVDQGFPLVNLKLFPPPSASTGTLILDYWTIIAAFATVGDSISLPPGYERALHLALAVELWPQYPKQSDFQVIKGMADDAKNSLMQLNAQILGAPAAPAAQSKQ